MKILKPLNQPILQEDKLGCITGATVLCLVGAGLAEFTNHASTLPLFFLAFNYLLVFGFWFGALVSTLALFNKQLWFMNIKIYKDEENHTDNDH